MENNKMPRFYCNTLSPQQNDFINLLQVGWDKCSPGYSYSHYRDMYIVHFVRSGSGTVETNGKRYVLSQNEAFIVRPNELMVQTTDNSQPWELFFFAFNGTFAKEIVEKTVFKNNTVSVSIQDDALPQLIIDIAAELNENPRHDIRTLEFLFKLLSHFDDTRDHIYSPPDNNNPYQKYIAAVQEYIQFNYSKSIKISELADQLNISRSHIYRIFKKYTGSSIEDYLVSVRINAARSLLSDTDLPTASIASLVGYAYYSTFFKIFKLHTGVTPKQYREEHSSKLGDVK